MDEKYKSIFKICLYVIKYEYNVKEEWEMSDDDNYVWSGDESDVFSDEDDY